MSAVARSADPRDLPHRVPVSRHRASGYTLIEVLLALGVLLTMATLVWPSLSRMFVDHNFRTAVDKLRVRMAGARLHALNHSWTYQFRFEPGGRKFIVIPYDLQASAADSSTSSGAGAVAGPQPFRFAGQLPEGISFQVAGGDDIVLERLSSDWLSGLAATEDLSDVSWSMPVLFYPDGTATFAEFQVTDSNKKSIRVGVRALTGTVRVSNVELQENR